MANEPVDRRSFLKSTLVAGGVLVTSGYGLRLLADAQEASGYGELFPRRAENTGEPLLAVPKGFRYNVLGRTGKPLSDGRVTPGWHDGMAAFQAGTKTRLIRNHEVRGSATSPIGKVEHSYDAAARGGTTTLIVDPKTRLIEESFVSLSGTATNCAGGPTPWGTWISCEETTVGPSSKLDEAGVKVGGLQKKHGYCFEVGSAAPGAPPEPIIPMGRFVHEAIAVDPRSGIVYLTEDQLDAGFYRYIPKTPKKLADGGRLEMLSIRGEPQFDTRVNQHTKVVRMCEWVPIEDIDPAQAETNTLAVFNQGHAAGAAVFGRLEGCWYGNGSIFLNSTNGGNVRRGQVWKYTPSDDNGGALELIFESPSREVLNSPDNLCVSPRGGLVLCEDCGDTVQHLRGLDSEGQLFDLARNTRYSSEFAGVTFSPDGETLYFNIQSPGLTIAMWGDWRTGPL